MNLMKVLNSFGKKIMSIDGETTQLKQKEYI